MIKLSACCLFSSFLFFMTPNCHGQELVGSQGGIAVGSLGSLSWSLGEPVTETVFSGSVVFNQGFQQNLNGNAGLEHYAFNELFDVFPNPAFDNLTVQPRTAIFSANLVLTDARGRVMIRLNDQHFPQSIELSELSPGLYCLTIELPNQIPVMTQVIKL